MSNFLFAGSTKVFVNLDSCDPVEEKHKVRLKGMRCFGVLMFPKLSAQSCNYFWHFTDCYCLQVIYAIGEEEMLLSQKRTVGIYW